MTGFWEHVVTVAGINAIAAWGLGIAIRAGQISAGHAIFAGLAGYALALATSAGMPMLVAVAIGLGAATTLGLVFSVAMIRLEHLFLAIATLALGEAAGILVSSSSALGGAVGLTGIPLVADWRWIVVAVVGVLLVELFVIRGSRFELELHLLAHDRTLVGLTGRSWKRVRVLSFTISALAVGFSGVLQAYTFGVVQPSDFTFARSLDLLVFAVIGGAASGYGPMVGAVGLTVLPEVFDFAAVDRLTLYGLVLVVVLVFRDDGILRRVPVPALRRLGPRRAGPPAGPLAKTPVRATRPTTSRTANRS